MTTFEKTVKKTKIFIQVLGSFEWHRLFGTWHLEARDMFERTTAGASAFNNTVWHVRESGVFVQASIVCILCSIEIKGPFTRNVCASVNR